MMMHLEKFMGKLLYTLHVYTHKQSFGKEEKIVPVKIWLGKYIAVGLQLMMFTH